MADNERFTFDLESMRKLQRMYLRQERAVESLRRELASHRRVQPAAPRLINFRNDSGEEVPRFACMRPTGAVRLGGRFYRTIAKPNTTFLRGRYLVNLSRRVEDGSRGVATFLDAEDGEVLCDASSSSPAVDEEWGPTPNEWYLTKNRNGFRILGAVAGTGASARALAQQRIVTEIRGKPYGADIAEGSSDTARVWWRNPTTDDWEDSTLELQVRALAVDLPEDEYCSLAYDSGEWIGMPFGSLWGWARLSGTLSALSSATARVWTDVAGTMTDSGNDITVYDRLLENGGSMATLTRIGWRKSGARYYVIRAACSADTSSTVWGT